MELLELSKKLRREIKKSGIELEKAIKEINKESRVLRGGVTGGVKEKREINLNAITKLKEEILKNGYTVNESFPTEGLVELSANIYQNAKAKDDVVMSLFVNLEVKKATLSATISMIKGKIALSEYVYTDEKTSSVVNFTLKDVKESLKTVKAE